MGNAEGFKRIRNQIAKRDILSLVMNASTKIRAIEHKNFTEWKGWLPWHLLLIIKWGFEYGGQHYPPKPVDEQVLAKLVNLVHGFEGKSSNPFLQSHTPSGFKKFLRTVAFQQFWLQGTLGTWEIARQSLLFCRLSDDHPIQSHFTQTFKLRMIEFLELAMMLWTWLISDSRNVVFNANTLFQNAMISQATIHAFLNTVSLSPPQVSQYLRERKQAVKNPFLQITEQSPFIRYPLLQLDNDYLVYSRRVFEEMIGTFFYNFMKSSGGSALSEEFASLLERYVERGLSYTSIKFYAEKDLRRRVQGKITDFVLPFDDCTVLVEVKAVEMRSTVRVYPDNEQLIRELKDSVVKAVMQGFSLANTFSQNNDSLEIPCRSDYFLLVVTYRDLYLGAGNEVWEEFLEDVMLTNLEKEGLDIHLVPPERLVFLSVDEFDQLISVLLEKSISLPTILREMVSDNSDPPTEKYTFAQHLEKHRSADIKLPYLDEESEQLRNDLLSKISK